MNHVHPAGPVFYASLAQTTDASAGSRVTTGEEARHRLIFTLWEHCMAGGSPLGKRSQASGIRVVRGLLGKPCLLLGEDCGPAISFSEGGGRVWAALCADASDIGIDVAGADEFPEGYPVQRVFCQQELHHAISLVGGDQEWASALLWSIKEAVVKALGCAFHLVDPRHINICPPRMADSGYAFPVGLSAKVCARFSIHAGQPIWVRSIPQMRAWLSIALVSGHY